METFKLLGIDPGKNIGISILTIQVDEYKSLEGITSYKEEILNNINFTIIEVETHTICMDNLTPDTVTDKQLYRLHILKNIINDIMITHEPAVLAIEEAFLNIKYPMAVMQLSQYLAIILQTAVSINPYLKLFKYPPKSVKSGIGAGGAAVKDGMFSVVSKIEEYQIVPNLTILTEHEIDSLAIAYVALKEIRLFPFLMYT